MSEGPSIRDRFPPPWRIAETPGGCKVTDATGNALAYLYASDKPHAQQPSTVECQALAGVVCAIANGIPPVIDLARFPAPWQSRDDDNSVRIVDGHNRSLIYLYVGAPGSVRPLARAECRAIASAVLQGIGGCRL